MARSEARLQFGIWRDGLDGLSPHAKLLYVVLLTEPTVNHAGVGAIRESRWARNAGLTPSEVADALNELTGGQYVVVDVDTEEVFVRTMIRDDGIAEQPNMLKGALREALNTASPTIRRTLAAELRKLPAKRADGVSKAGRPVTYPDPHAAAAALDPNPPSSPSSAEPFPKGSGTLPDDFHARSETPGGGGGGGGGGDVSSSVGTPVGGTARSRGTRLPAEFNVTPEMVAWCRERTPDINGALETERFTNYFGSAPGAKGLKTDWVKTWKNWMLEEQKRSEQRRPNHLRAVSGGARPTWLPAHYDDDGVIRDKKTGVAIER